jgi:hypothetical protein
MPRARHNPALWYREGIAMGKHFSCGVAIALVVFASADSAR